jgi:hypothetical protein
MINNNNPISTVLFWNMIESFMLILGGLLILFYFTCFLLIYKVIFLFNQYKKIGLIIKNEFSTTVRFITISIVNVVVQVFI